MSVPEKPADENLTDDTSKISLMLTNHGNPIALVGTEERLGAEMRLIRQSTLLVLDDAADKVADRSFTSNLEKVCADLGLDLDKVIARAKAKGAPAYKP
jgi:hypothetical protein